MPDPEIGILLLGPPRLQLRFHLLIMPPLPANTALLLKSPFKSWVRTFLSHKHLAPFSGATPGTGTGTELIKAEKYTGFFFFLTS